MLPTYTSVMQEQQAQHGPQPDSGGEQPDGSLRQASFRRSYTGLHEQQQQRQQLQVNTLSALSVKDGSLELNLTFLQSPAGGLLAVSSILGIVVSICGAASPMWSQAPGAGFCVFSGLMHFAGGTFLFFVYLFNFLGEMPWYTRALAIYYFINCAVLSLTAFVYSASNFPPAAIASAVFTFLALAVDIVLTVLSYMALKMGYGNVQATLDSGDA